MTVGNSSTREDLERTVKKRHSGGAFRSGRTLEFPIIIFVCLLRQRKRRLIVIV